MDRVGEVKLLNACHVGRPLSRHPLDLKGAGQSLDILSGVKSSGDMNPIVLTCGRVRQTFDVPADRAGETCHCPYCGDPHRVPKPWATRLRRARGSAAVAAPAPRPARFAPADTRFRLALAGVCGFLLGVIAGSGLSEFSYDRPASSLVLEKLLQQAHEERRQAIQACADAKSQLLDARDERQQFERERDEALRRVREMQAGLDDALETLQRLRQ